MSNEFEKFISENREAFDDRFPDAAVLERIHARLDIAQRKQGILIPMKVIRWAAAACFILVAGAAAFFLLPEKHRTAMPVNAKTEIRTPSPAAADPVSPGTAVPKENPVPVAHQAMLQQKKYTTPIDEELSVRKQLLFAKLNDMRSPGQRIMAVEQAYEIAGGSNRDIVDALVRTMDSDPNTNVRLAALEALGRFHRESYVKKQLVSSLRTQKDPIVQIELIQMLTRMKQVSILGELEKITGDDNTLKAVKDHAYAGILTLKS